MALANVELDEAYLYAFGRAAAETAEPGPVLWVRYRPENPNEAQRVKRMRAALLQGLGSGEWSIIEHPDDGMAAEALGRWNISTYGGGWGGQLMEWVGAAPSPSAIILSVALPRLSSSQWNALPPVFFRMEAWTVNQELRANVARNGGRLALQKALHEWDYKDARSVRDPMELFKLEHDWLDDAP